MSEILASLSAYTQKLGGDDTTTTYTLSAAPVIVELIGNVNELLKILVKQTATNMETNQNEYVWTDEDVAKFINMIKSWRNV